MQTEVVELTGSSESSEAEEPSNKIENVEDTEEPLSTIDLGEETENARNKESSILSYPPDIYKFTILVCIRLKSIKLYFLKSIQNFKFIGLK